MRKRFAIIGKNIGYTLSPRIHEAIFKYCGLADYSYESIDLGEQELQDSFWELVNRFDGFNVTIPYKKTLSTLITTNNSPIFAVNTIVCNEGETVGYNTDIEGFWTALRESNMIEPILSNPNRESVLIIGAGGASESALYVLNNLQITPYIKTREGSAPNGLAERYSINSDYLSAQPTLIINASGKNLIEDKLLDDINCNRLACIFDMSYNYKELASVFGSRRIRYKNGLDMLVYQAIHAASYLYELSLENKVGELFDYINEAVHRY